MMRHDRYEANIRLVFLMLFYIAGARHRCHPSIETICEMCCLTDEEVKYALFYLDNMEFIRINKHKRQDDEYVILSKLSAII